MKTESQHIQAQAGQYLIFSLQDQNYGVAIATVCEINRLIRISPVPQVPAFVSGVMNLRGKVVPVVDLSQRFGFGPNQPTRETCIIVTESHCGQVGNIVDRVQGVADLSQAQIQPPPLVNDAGRQSFVIGIGQADSSVIILVNLAEVLSQHVHQDMSGIVDALTTEQGDAA